MIGNVALLALDTAGFGGMLWIVATILAPEWNERQNTDNELDNA